MTQTLPFAASLRYRLRHRYATVYGFTTTIGVGPDVAAWLTGGDNEGLSLATVWCRGQMYLDCCGGGSVVVVETG